MAASEEPKEEARTALEPEVELPHLPASATEMKRHAVAAEEAADNS
jgi:hypothetical protein